MCAFSPRVSCATPPAPWDEAEYRRWLPLVAAARLSEGIAAGGGVPVNMAGG
ncbi:MAG: hypothetical protein R2851_15380 [Caldilineaceae bacterium]